MKYKSNEEKIYLEAVSKGITLELVNKGFDEVFPVPELGEFPKSRNLLLNIGPIEHVYFKATCGPFIREGVYFHNLPLRRKTTNFQLVG